MPHAFDFDSVEARLFTLHRVCLGSRPFCEKFQIDRIYESRGEYEWWEYLGHLKSLVSGTLIDAAVKIRMLQDFAKHEDEELDISSMQIEATEGLNIGYAVPNRNPISLRQSCNKIIHATGARLVWREDIGAACKFEYWVGEYHLFGAEQSGAKWETIIFVPDWCTAMIRFNRDFQEKIDWSHVIKWDE